MNINPKLIAEIVIGISGVIGLGVLSKKTSQSKILNQRSQTIQITSQYHLQIHLSAKTLLKQKLILLMLSIQYA